MSVEIGGRILMVVSDDGKRCDEKCPSVLIEYGRDATDEGYSQAFCESCAGEPLDYDEAGDGWKRHAACIAAERAAKEAAPEPMQPVDHYLS